MNIKKMAVEAAIEASRPTPPDSPKPEGKVVAYTVDGFICQDGDEPFYYLASDYEAMQQECERLREALVSFTRSDYIKHQHMWLAKVMGLEVIALATGWPGMEE